ncbi:MAG: cbb3-type cytochrome c oxidase subunit I, partial [Planctomycetaceae bacterium]|nr:cbb3-type cytochrome c oxidase subunit I [Planctomycetaceae bacterium]
MATTTVEGVGHGHAQDVDFYHESRGLKSWLFTLDHKRIGIMYLVGTLTAFMIAGILALIFRAELLTPQIDLLVNAANPNLQEAASLGRDLYNKLFTLHGALMVFVFIIPVVPAALGNFFLPLMLGAKDVAFPRLNLLSFYIWV